MTSGNVGQEVIIIIIRFIYKYSHIYIYCKLLKVNKMKFNQKMRIKFG